MEKNVVARRITGTEELLSALGSEQIKAATKKSRKVRWQQILVISLCVLSLAAAGKGFLYLDSEIGAVQSAVRSAVNDLKTLRTQVDAVDTRERIGALIAELDELRVTNAQLLNEVEQIKETYETFKPKQNTVTSRRQKRR